MNDVIWTEEDYERLRTINDMYKEAYGDLSERLQDPIGYAARKEQERIKKLFEDGLDDL